MSEHHDVMPSQVEVLVPVGALHPDGSLAQEPGFEFPARDHATILTHRSGSTIARPDAGALVTHGSVVTDESAEASTRC